MFYSDFVYDILGFVCCASYKPAVSILSYGMDEQFRCKWRKTRKEKRTCRKPLRVLH